MWCILNNRYRVSTYFYLYIIPRYTEVCFSFKRCASSQKYSVFRRLNFKLCSHWKAFSEGINLSILFCVCLIHIPTINNLLDVYTIDTSMVAFQHDTNVFKLSFEMRFSYFILFNWKIFYYYFKLSIVLSPHTHYCYCKNSFTLIFEESV